MIKWTKGRFSSSFLDRVAAGDLVVGRAPYFFIDLGYGREIRVWKTSTYYRSAIYCKAIQRMYGYSRADSRAERTPPRWLLDKNVATASSMRAIKSKTLNSKMGKHYNFAFGYVGVENTIANYIKHKDTPAWKEALKTARILKVLKQKAT
jgi:hypothetical protein